MANIRKPRYGGKRNNSPPPDDYDFDERLYETELTYFDKESGIEIKIIKPIDDSKATNTPSVSHSKNAIYAIINKKGESKQITVYRDNRTKDYDIDLDHNHSGDAQYNNGHVHYYDNEGNRDKNYSLPNDYQKKLIQLLQDARRVKANG